MLYKYLFLNVYMHHNPNHLFIVFSNQLCDPATGGGGGANVVHFISRVIRHLSPHPPPFEIQIVDFYCQVLTLCFSLHKTNAVYVPLKALLKQPAPPPPSVYITHLPSPVTSSHTPCYFFNRPCQI